METHIKVIFLLAICFYEINSSEIKHPSKITHLHEVNETPGLKSEYNPQKQVKKKPYAILEKPSDIDKHRHKSYEDHSAVYDFNVHHLEDEHENIKNIGLNRKEQDLLSDDDDDDDMEMVFSEAVSTTHNSFDDLEHNAKFFNPNPSNLASTTFKSIGGSQNIFKVAKNKSKAKGRELFRKEELQKHFGNHFNSVSQYLTDHGNHSSHTEAPAENYFQILVNFYDHFYWQPSDIRGLVTPVCGVELLAYLSALNNNYEFAQKAYDSSARYRGHFLFGNSLWVGQKTFCDEVNSIVHERRHFEFGFSVATISVKASLPANMTRIVQLGECLPKSCNIKDIKTILEMDPHVRLFTSLNSTVPKSEVRILKVRHVPGDYNIWKHLKFKLFSAFIIFIIAIMCYASWLEMNIKERDELQKNANISEKYENEKKTINVVKPDNNINGKAFELYQMNSVVVDNNNVDVEARDLEKLKQTEIKNKKFEENSKTKDGMLLDKKAFGFFEKLVLCFAFPSNASAIFTLKRSNEELLSCVHGIRVFSLLWTILVHTYLQIFLIGENKFRRNIAERSFIYQMIGNATFSVDSFFFLSGLLVVLIFLKNEKAKEVNSKDFIKKGIIQTIFLAAYRYIRLTPVYLFVIIFNELSLNYVFNRSVFIPTEANVTCTNYWWRNILYINNFFPLKDLCMIWSWYLANDMQFYIMAITLLIFSTRYLKFSVITIIAFLIISWGTAGIISIHYHYIHKVAEPFESFDFLYDKPWQRIGSYIIGMMTGYIIFKYKTPPKLPFGLNTFLWVLSVGLLFILIFGVWDGTLNVLATAFYVSIGHTAWGLGLVWITLSCYWGFSPSINTFLSYELFLPLSRLTYCTYLVHPIIMMITSFLMEGPVQLQHVLVLTMFLGNAVLSFMVAFFISVAFEAPVIRLLRIFLKK